MGMYTELIFNASMENPPEDVINILQFMCKQIPNTIPKLPDHSFFKTERWSHLFTMSSYYFVSTITPSLYFDGVSKDWRISTRSNLKNYDNEIEKFLDWIKPYLSCGVGLRDMYAVVTYEEAEEPTLYYLDKPDEEE